MRLSEQWLRKWVNLDIGIYEISEQMTRSGLEVEEIKDMLYNVKNVVVGEIISFYKHPHIDHVNIVQVNINKKKNLNIICRAKNCKNHMKVVVALVGAVLPGNIVIQLITFKGVLSEGMLCSFADLDMFGHVQDIIELPFDAPIGINLVNYNFYIDKIIKINITPNRMDALGILGIARDISILNNLSLPVLHQKTLPVTIRDECYITLQIRDMFFSYSGRCIKNINLRSQTPLWMKERLRRCHIPCVNVVVDIINYSFIELGQSVYVFSFLNTISNIFLRFAHSDEKIVINHKKNIILDNKVIVISDKNTILSFLGNVNFNLFPINLDDTNILLGSFFIHPECLASSNYHVKLNNAHIVRNEYHVDPGLQLSTIEYITNLFLKICGGYIGPITQYFSDKFHTYKKNIKLYNTHIKDILGYEIHPIIVYTILKKLGYSIKKSVDFLCITPPTWRLDINIVEDVISDIMRIYQSDDVFSMPLSFHQSIIPNDIVYNTLKRVKYLLIDKGYHEVINYSFVDSAIQNLIYPNKNTLLLKNPISSDMSSMRLSLWTGLIKTFLYHQNRQYEEIRLFESGVCFLPDRNYKLGVRQDLFLSGIIGSINFKKYWDTPSKRLDFYDVKGDVESIFSAIGYLEEIQFQEQVTDGLHPNNSLIIKYNNKIIGNIGLLHPILLGKLHLKYNVFLFEILWDKLFFQDLLPIKNIASCPISRRDISIIVSKYVLSNDLVVACKHIFPDKIIDIRIFDIYTGSSISCNQKSISLSLFFQHIHRTLTDVEVDCMVNSCLSILKQKFQARLRD